MSKLGIFILLLPTLHAQGVSFGAGVRIGGNPLTVINLGVQSGVDCSGTSDSAAGINTVLASLSGKDVVIPVGCTLRVNSQLTIQGQTDFVFEGAGFMPNQGAETPVIFGCSGSTGPVLYINRSSYFEIKNFGVYAKGTACSSSFTGGIAWANTGAGGYTSTYAHFYGLALEPNPNGSTISGFFGVGVGVSSSGIGGSSGPNMEQAVFENNFIHCQNSANSKGIWMDAGNADNGGAINNRIDSCFQAIRQDAGNLKLIEKNHFASNGNFSVFGTNGASVYISTCSSGGISIIANESSDGGPFFNSNNDLAGGGCQVSIIGNVIGVSDLGSAAYPVNLGAFISPEGPYTLISNQIFITANTTATAIGSSSQTSCAHGPLGQLVDISNTINDLTKVGGWTGCVDGSIILPFQSGEYHQFSPLGNKTILVERGAGAEAATQTMTYAFPDVTANTQTCDKIGRIWYDTTTTTTALKVCLNVSGTLTWVTK